MHTNDFSRRRFLGFAATAASIAIVPGHVLGGDKRNAAPSEKLNIAGIGVGGMGWGNLNQMRSENIVALCDVDHAYASRTFKKYSQAKVWKDYRKMLDQQKDIDAVLIATPDHTHAVISMAAMKAGKHVYCQKPLTHDVYEARVLAKVAKETGVTTQMGIQGHSMDHTRVICEWIWSGAIGEVRSVDAWCDLSYYPWGHASWSSKHDRRPTDKPAVPSTLDWDLWIGPAPMRPYHPAYHPRVWRCWLDFGSGMMGDRGAHTLDSAFWALKLGAPSTIEATSCGQSKDQHALAAVVTYKFPARGDLPPVKLTWYEGVRAPRPEELEDERRMPGQGGILYNGTKGKIMAGVYGNGARIIPEARMKEVGKPPQKLPRVKGTHEMDWIRSCKEGKPAGAHFGYSGPLTEVCVLGNVAKRVDGRIHWDAEKLEVTNNKAANQYVRKPYRDGWSL
jgi:predicted dehydrogenase